MQLKTSTRIQRPREKGEMKTKEKRCSDNRKRDKRALR